LANSDDHSAHRNEQDQTVEILGFEVPVWAMCAAGLAAILLLIYATTIRPTQRQLARLRVQVGQLEDSIRQLTGETESASGVRSLLESLAKQREHANHAGEALEQLVALQDHLLTARASLPTAQDNVEALLAITGRLNDGRAMTRTARASLDEFFALKDRALDQGQDLPRLQRVLAQQEALHEELLKAEKLVARTRRTSDALLDVHTDLLDRGSNAQQAREALTGLIEIRDRLESENSRLELATTRLNALLTIKDNILAQTDNLAGVIETLEVTDELQAQLQEAGPMFRGMRRDLVEILTLNTTLQNAMKILRPLTDLADLRRLEDDDVRYLTRRILERRKNRTSGDGSADAISGPVGNDADRSVPIAAAPALKLD